MCTSLSLVLTTVLLASAPSLVHGNVVSLTPENYESLTANKVVMIKAFAPWCGHCKAMGPDWARLASDYTNDANFLIAEVDCTLTATESWCDQALGVEAFPTIFFGDPAHDGAMLEEYEGERDYESLSEFAKDMFATPLCNVNHLDGCNEETKAKLESFMKLSEDEIDEELERMEQAMDDAEEAFEDKFDELQDEYDEMSTAHEKNIAGINRELRIYKEIKELKVAGATKTE